MMDVSGAPLGKLRERAAAALTRLEREALVAALRADPRRGSGGKGTAEFATASSFFFVLLALLRCQNIT